MRESFPQLFREGAFSWVLRIPSHQLQPHPTLSPSTPNISKQTFCDAEKGLGRSFARGQIWRINFSLFLPSLSHFHPFAEAELENQGTAQLLLEGASLYGFLFPLVTSSTVVHNEMLCFYHMECCLHQR